MTGIVRNLDSLCRVVPPSEMRDQLGIGAGDPVEMFMMDDMICIRKAPPNKLKCVLCGSTDEESHKVIDGVHVCIFCIAKFGGK